MSQNKARLIFCFKISVEHGWKLNHNFVREKGYVEEDRITCLRLLAVPYLSMGHRFSNQDFEQVHVHGVIIVNAPLQGLHEYLLAIA